REHFRLPGPSERRQSKFFNGVGCERRLATDARSGCDVLLRPSVAGRRDYERLLERYCWTAGVRRNDGSVLSCARKKWAPAGSVRSPAEHSRVDHKNSSEAARKAEPVIVVAEGRIELAA